jgi:hypothetical protein
MPTGKDTRNPGALMKDARRTRDRQARAQAAADVLLSHLAHSEEFAAQFDEAVMREDKDMILGLIAEAGVWDEAEVTIVELDPDRMIEIKFCFGRFCVSIRFSW